MKPYWDSSALVAASADLALRTRLRAEGGVTRTHALAETFSALTGGNLALRVDADAAARMVDSLAQDLDFVDLTSKEILDALKPGEDLVALQHAFEQADEERARETDKAP